MYFGARYYNPYIQRWLAVDPLHNKYHEWSPYVYVKNNPLRLIDPDGMQSRPSGPTVSYLFKQVFAGGDLKKFGKGFANHASKEIGSAAGTVSEVTGVTGAALMFIPGGQGAGGILLGISTAAGALEIGANWVDYQTDDIKGWTNDQTKDAITKMAFAAVRFSAGKIAKELGKMPAFKNFTEKELEAVAELVIQTASKMAEQKSTIDKEEWRMSDNLVKKYKQSSNQNPYNGNSIVSGINVFNCI